MIYLFSANMPFGMSKNRQTPMIKEFSELSQNNYEVMHFMVNPVVLGKNTRMSYAKIDEVLEMPNLIEVQKNSYRWFLEEGIKEVFRDVSPISDYSGNLELEFIDYSFDEEPKYSVERSRERDTTYATPLRVKVRLINKETGVVK